MNRKRVLWLLRHAKSDWDVGALNDFDRPLNHRGKRDARRIGCYMAAQGWFPEAVIASPAKRVRQTIKRVCRELNFDFPRVEWDQRIYEAEVPDLLAVLRDCTGNCDKVLLVGHNPGLEALLLTLCGPVPEPGDKLLPTAALAYLEVRTPWKDLGPGMARLVRLIRPRDLPEQG